MSNIQYNLTTDNSQFLQGMQQADNAQKALAKGIIEVEKDFKKAFDEAGKGAANAGKETEKLNEKTKSLKQQYRDAKVALADATDPEEIIKLSRKAGELADRIGDANEAAAIFATESPFEAVGNSIGGVIGKLRNLDFKGAADQSKLLVSASKSITFKEGIQGVKDLGTTLVNMGKSLLMNPIFLLGTAITLIITNFDKLKNAGGLVGDVFTSIGKAIGIVIDLGSDFLNFIGLIDSAKKSLEDLVKMNEAMMANINARYDLEIAKAKAAGKETARLEESKLKVALINQKYILNATREQYRVGEIDAKQYAEKLQEIGLAANKADQDLFNLKAQERQKAAEKQKKAADELAQALLDLLKKSQAAELSMLTGKAKLDFQKKLSEQEVAELEKALKKKLQAAGKGNKLSAEQEREIANLKMAINAEYYNGILNLAVQEANKEAEFNKRKTDTDIQFLDAKYSIAKNKIEATQALEGSTSLQKETFEKQKNKHLLEIELRYQEEKLALLVAQIEAEANVKKTALQGELKGLEGNNSEAAKARKAQIEAEINGITEGANLATEGAKTSFEKVKSELTNQINSIAEALNKLGYKIDWQDILGLSDKDMEAIKQNYPILLSEATKFINQYLELQDSILQKELDNNAKKKELLEQEMSELESKLKTENELKNDGLANDSKRLQEAFEEKKKQRDEALEQEKQIKKEQEKLAKEQLLIDQATQASSLVTAIAQIFSSTAGAGPIGVILAGVTIAAMLASFAYAQGQASDAVNKADSSYWKGGYVGDGGKYEEKGTVHGGEFVTTKEKTVKHRNLLEGIHQDNPRLIELGIGELLKSSDIDLPNISNEIKIEKSKLKAAEMRTYFNTDNKGVERKIDELKNEMKSLNRTASESQIVLPDGTIIMKKGTNTTVIRRKK